MERYNYLLMKRRGLLRWLGQVSASAMLVLAAAGCDLRGMSLVNPPTPTPGVLSQWAVTATSSSSYAYPDWSPNRATGAPEIDGCADDPRAWTSARGNGVEWLQLDYARPVFASEVRIYQSYGPGAISRVTLMDAEGDGLVVWEGIDNTEPCPAVLAIRVPTLPGPVKTVRIDLDESRTGTWDEIDAVELIGAP